MKPVACDPWALNTVWESVWVKFFYEKNTSERFHMSLVTFYERDTFARINDSKDKSSRRMYIIPHFVYLNLYG